jgi:hypothetical protein
MVGAVGIFAHVIGRESARQPNLGRLAGRISHMSRERLPVLRPRLDVQGPCVMVNGTLHGDGQRELRDAAPAEHFVNLRQVHFLATNFGAGKLLQRYVPSILR